MNLTATEYRIAEQLTQGKLQKEIAEELFVSPHTVRNHTVNIMKKLDARNVVDVARIFILENPKKFFTSVAFLIIHAFIVFNCETMELRRPVRTQVRTSKTARKYN